MSTSGPTTTVPSSADLADAKVVGPAGLAVVDALAWMERAAASPEGHRGMLALARRTRDAALPAREVAFCGILQAKLGGCAEDCAFCCQSRHHRAIGRRGLPMAGFDEMLARAKDVAATGARAFSVVAAGRRLHLEREIDVVCRVVEAVTVDLGLEACASLGRVTTATLRRLRDAGLRRYHHNIETAPSFFGEVITTYGIEESLETLAAARGEGLELCSSGVFGLGETDAQRVELIDLLRRVGVEGLPLCFLEPHPGTPLEGRPFLEFDEALRIIALHRLMMPSADVIVTGGRVLVLGDRRGEALDAGANGVMVGDYPTALGDELERDLRSVRERGLELRPPR